MNLFKKIFFAGLGLSCLNTTEIKTSAVSNLNFNTSVQQEFKQAVDFQSKCMPEKTEQEIRKYLSLFSTGTTKKDHIMTLQDLRACVLQNPNNSAMAEQVQDIQDTFNALKQRMAIPDEVEILFLKDDAEDALYNVFDRKVYLSPRFFGDGPTKKLFKLIHELTHCQQHMREGLIAMSDGKKNAVHERQADIQAAQAISCPICMQIVEDDFSDDKDRARLGYLTKADIAAYKSNKQAQDICSAHKADTVDNQRLKALLQVSSESLNIFQKALAWMQADKKSIQRAELDFQIGYMKDRLSSVRFNK